MVVARTMAVNTVGLAATFHPFIAPMVSRGKGTLVGVASVAGIGGLPGHGAYCASKAGAIAYCESLRGELAEHGIKVVTLCPAYVDTPLTHNNTYLMPFLMSVQDFALQAVRSIEAGHSYQAIPWQMQWVAKALRLLPKGLFDRALYGRPRKQRGGPN